MQRWYICYPPPGGTPGSLRQSPEREIQSEQQQAGEEHRAKRGRRDALPQHLAELHAAERRDERQRGEADRLRLPDLHAQQP